MNEPIGLSLDPKFARIASHMLVNRWTQYLSIPSMSDEHKHYLNAQIKAYLDIKL